MSSYGMARPASGYPYLVFLFLLDVALKRGARFIATLRGHVAAVYRLSWSADSRMLVSASKDSTLKVGSVDLSDELLGLQGSNAAMGSEDVQDSCRSTWAHAGSLLCRLCSR